MQPARSPQDKHNPSVQESTDGITLISDPSSSESDPEDSVQHINSVLEYEDDETSPNLTEKEKSKRKKNLHNNDDDDELIFEPTSSMQTVSGSQKDFKENEGEGHFNEKDKFFDEVSYNDTLSYLEDVLGSTYLNNLSKNSFIKQRVQLPPKIESSSTCAKITPQKDFKNQKQQNPLKLNEKQLVLRSAKEDKIPDTKMNPFIKKIQSNQIPSREEYDLREKKENKDSNKIKKSKDDKRDDKKRDVSINKSVLKIKRKEQGRDKSPARTDKSPLRTGEPRRQKKGRYEQQYNNYHQQQRPIYQEKYSSHHHQKQEHPEYRRYDQNPQNYPPHYGFPRYQQVPYYNNNNYIGYREQANGPYHKQAQYDGPGQYFIPAHKRKRQKADERNHRQMHDVVNGWNYPNRGNVMYDTKQRPWVLQGQMGIEDRHFSELMKKQYHTPFQRQALSIYMQKRNPYAQYINSHQFYSSPYDQHSGHNNMVQNDLYHQSNSITVGSEPSNNSQISTKTTPLNQKTNNQEISARELPSNVRDAPSNVQPKMNEVRVAQKLSTKTSPKDPVRPPPMRQEQALEAGQHAHEVRQHANEAREHASQKYRPKVYQPQQISARILPPDILKKQAYLQQPKQHIQMAPIILPKDQNKPHLKSQVFLLYHIPIIVSNDELKSLSAQIFIVPYSHLMIQENQPSKWIDYLQKQTGIDIMKKLYDMNMKQINEKGRDIPQGTLSMVRLSRKMNFSSMYLIKLTNFIDAQSRKPYGQTLLRDSISKILDDFISASQNVSNRQNTLLIHGGYFPGVLRDKTPKLIANYMSLALANLSVEYRNPSKGLKIIIHVPKQEEYQEYIKNFRLVLNEYRKLQAI